MSDTTLQQQRAAAVEQIKDEDLESIATSLWNDRAQYPNLADEEFATREDLLATLKLETRAIGSFNNLTGAQDWFASLNDDKRDEPLSKPKYDDPFPPVIDPWADPDEDNS